MQTTYSSSYSTAKRAVARTSGAGSIRLMDGYNESLNQKQNEHLPGYSIASFTKIAFLVTFILFVVTVSLYMGAVYFGEGLSRGGHSQSEEKLDVVIANQRLSIKTNTIRFPSQRRTGLHSSLDLYLHWPSLSGYRDELKQDFNSLDENTNLLFLKIEPRSMSFDMSGRLQPIYSLFFEGIAIKQPHGLVRQPLSEAGGFINEDIYYQADNPYPFVARCVRETSNISAPYCLRDIHIGKELTLSYRFHKRYLNNWFALEEAIQKYVRELVAK